MTGTPQTQIDRSKQATREPEAGDDEARFDERVRKPVKPKPDPAKGGTRGG